MIIPISIKVLKELFNHNSWASERQLQVCAKLSDEQFLKPLGSSFSSLRDTLVHMIVVEKLWVERYHGEIAHYKFEPEEYPNLLAVQQYWQSVEKETQDFLSTLNERTVEQPLTVVSSRGQTWSHPLWRFILHLLNHQSYHRGQVTTMLRQLGVQPARVDFLDTLDAEFKA